MKEIKVLGKWEFNLGVPEVGKGCLLSSPRLFCPCVLPNPLRLFVSWHLQLATLH